MIVVFIGVLLVSLLLIFFLVICFNQFDGFTVLYALHVRFDKN